MSRRFTPEEGAQRAFYDDAYLQYHRAAYDNLCANGKLFTGIKRPRGKGFRQMTRKQCFANAQCVAVLGNNLATYVEGLCIHPEMPNFPFSHAWLTLDGEHAIDVTLPDAESCAYFGIAFDNHQVSQFISTNKCWGSRR